MATTHISAAEAAKDFESLLQRAQRGETVVIEKDSIPVATVSAPMPQMRLLSEIIASMQQREAELGDAALLDPEFAEIVEDKIRNRKPIDHSKWD